MKLLLFYFEVLLFVVRQERVGGLLCLLFELWIGFGHLVRGSEMEEGSGGRMGRDRGPLDVSDWSAKMSMRGITARSYWSACRSVP